MTKDKSTAIALLGIGAVAIYALTRQQKTDELVGVFPDAWSGGSATPPKQDPTPIIQLPEIPPPYVEQQPPEWLFYPPLPYYPEQTGSTGTVTHKKEIVPPTITTSTYSTGDPIHPSMGPTGGFGGGGAGGRGDTQSGGIGDVLKSLFSPLTLFASATPFGIVAAAPQAGLALASTVTKKEEKVAEKTAFESATDSAAKVATGGGSVTSGGGSVTSGGGSVAGGGSTSVAASSKKTISAPSEDIADFFTSGKSYGSATPVGHSSGGTVYQHSGGARSVVSGGQIVASSSRALDAADIARLPKKTREILGY